MATPVKEICRQYEISSARYYEWKAKFGGLGVADIKRLKELESESSKVKSLCADIALEITLKKPIKKAAQMS